MVRGPVLDRAFFRLANICFSVAISFFAPFSDPDARAREITLSAIARNSLARLELRRSISLRKASNCRHATLC
jgi:hypothetical protein